ncbi:hypothetical protein [Bacillus phage vB_BanS-Thrax4]|nr:hypothetical protein [Bacillus phage vB_BanS-Thrax4]
MKTFDKIFNRIVEFVVWCGIGFLAGKGLGVVVEYIGGMF